MWQTVAVFLILAVVVVYAARQVVRMVRSKTPTCSGCIGCSAFEGTPPSQEKCEGR
jgi:hypothetical protein